MSLAWSALYPLGYDPSSAPSLGPVLLLAGLSCRGGSQRSPCTRRPLTSAIMRYVSADPSLPENWASPAMLVPVRNRL